MLMSTQTGFSKIVIKKQNITAENNQHKSQGQLILEMQIK